MEDGNEIWGRLGETFLGRGRVQDGELTLGQLRPVHRLGEALGSKLLSPVQEVPGRLRQLEVSWIKRVFHNIPPRSPGNLS